MMNWTLEVVVVPVADVDRAKTFYADKVGFHVDHDTGMVDMPPGSLRGLQLVVSDIHAAHAQLVERGVDVSDVQVYDVGGLRPSREGDDLNNIGFVHFSDPDGNGWAVQQISSRA
jgi:catechol 2,3-dioxygenase-like lactoylglutathione lyase family enzyme